MKKLFTFFAALGLAMTMQAANIAVSGSAPAGDMLTCAEAAQIAAENGYKGTTEVTVYGYVTELVNDKVDNNGTKNNRSGWQTQRKAGSSLRRIMHLYLRSLPWATA